MCFKKKCTSKNTNIQSLKSFIVVRDELLIGHNWLLCRTTFSPILLAQSPRGSVFIRVGFSFLLPQFFPSCPRGTLSIDDDDSGFQPFFRGRPRIRWTMMISSHHSMLQDLRRVRCAHGQPFQEHMLHEN